MTELIEDLRTAVGDLVHLGGFALWLFWRFLLSAAAGMVLVAVPCLILVAVTGKPILLLGVWVWGGGLGTVIFPFWVGASLTRGTTPRSRTTPADPAHRLGDKATGTDGEGL